MKGLILAAGYATRMYPLTKDFPKPLLKVGEHPIIDYIVSKLDSVKEIDEIIVVTNSKFISLFQNWAKKLKTDKPVVLVDDLTCCKNDRRGAIGDILFVLEKIKPKDDLLVIGGDNLFSQGLEDFLSFIRSNPEYPVVGAFDIKDKRAARNYGVLCLDNSHTVVDFAEKPKQPRSSLVAMCLYYFPHRKLRLIWDYVKEKNTKKDATGFYIDWLRKKTPTKAYIFQGSWLDIGHPYFYQKANKEFATFLQNERRRKR